MVFRSDLEVGRHRIVFGAMNFVMRHRCIHALRDLSLPCYGP